VESKSTPVLVTGDEEGSPLGEYEVGIDEREEGFEKLLDIDLEIDEKEEAIE